MSFEISTLFSDPQAFRLFSTIVQALGIVVAFMISYLGFKAYKLTNDRKYKYFFYGFLFLSLSFLANVILNILLRLGYAKYFVEKRYTPYIAPMFGIYYFFLIAVMLAYVSLAIVYSDIKKPNKIWLFYFWTFIVGVYTFRDYLLFNMFSALLLSFVVLFTFEKYRESRKKNQLAIFLAFLSLFLFHFLVIIEKYATIILPIRYIILLAGLVLLLVTLLKIHGRKKK